MEKFLFFITLSCLWACHTTTFVVPAKPVHIQKVYVEDDYPYEYSSRIRRFHQHEVCSDYYDPLYVDICHYDNWYLPGTSIYTVNDCYVPYHWRSPSWVCWSDPYVYSGWNFSWNVSFHFGFGYNQPWCSNYVYSNYYYDPYWVCNGYNSYYADPVYYTNGAYYTGGNYYTKGNFFSDANHNTNGMHFTNGNYQNKTYTGARTGGTNVNAGYARMQGSGRLSPSTEAPTLERKIPTAEQARKPVSDRPAEIRKEMQNTPQSRPQTRSNEPVRNTRDSRSIQQKESQYPRRERQNPEVERVPEKRQVRSHEQQEQRRVERPQRNVQPQRRETTQRQPQQMNRQPQQPQRQMGQQQNRQPQMQQRQQSPPRQQGSGPSSSRRGRN